MGDKYVSNALMMSTKNNLYEHIPYFLYCYLMKATIVFVNLLSHYLQRAYDEDATIYHFWYIIVVDAPLIQSNRYIWTKSSIDIDKF